MNLVVSSAWTQSHLGHKEAQNAVPAHLSGTLQSTFSSSPLVFSQSFAVTFDPMDPNDSAHVAAPLTGNFVELHLAVLVGSGMVMKRVGIWGLSVMEMERVLVVAPRTGRMAQEGRRGCGSGLAKPVVGFCH